MEVVPSVQHGGDIFILNYLSLLKLRKLETGKSRDEKSSQILPKARNELENENKI